jgi:hypothetical protein
MDKFKILLLSFWGILLINRPIVYARQLDETKYDTPDTLNSSNFDRVPVTFLFRCEKDEYANVLSNIIDSVYEYEGIFKNDPGVRRIESLKDKERRDQPYYSFNAAGYANSEIDSQKIVNKIIGKAYNRSVSGAFDFGTIKNILNLKEGAVITPVSGLSTSKILKNAGEMLMDNSYIIVFELFDIYKVEAENSPAKSMVETYRVKISAYLYKIEFNHKTASLFYKDLWVGSEDTVNQDKVDKFNKFTFRISFKKRYDLRNYSVNLNNSGSGANRKNATEEAIKNSIDKLLRKIYVKPFNAKSPHNLFFGPASIRTGKNLIALGSSVKPFSEQKYEVYQLKAKTLPKSKVDKIGNAVLDTLILLNKIAEIQLKKASPGQSMVYEYNQLSGKKLEDNYLIKPKRDLGFAVTGGYGFSLMHRNDQDQPAFLFGNGGYLFLRGELNLSRIGSRYLHLNMPASVYFFLEGGFMENYYDHYRYNASKYISSYNGHTVALVYEDLSQKGFKEVFVFSKSTVKYGIGKEFHFKSNFYCTPFVAYGNSKFRYNYKFDATDYLSQSGGNMLIRLPVEQDIKGEYFYQKIENNDILLKQSEVLGGFGIGIKLGFNVHLQYSVEGSFLRTVWSDNRDYYFPDMSFADDFDIRMNLALKIQF